MPISVKPFRDKHAIEVAVLAIDLKLVDAVKLNGICSDLLGDDSLKEIFQFNRSINSFSITMTEKGQEFSSQVGGIEFHDKDFAVAPSWVLSVTPDFVSLACHDYDRWNSVAKFSFGILGIVLKVLSTHKAFIHGFGLQYVDSFKILGTSDKNEIAASVLNLNSSLLPLDLQTRKDLWHVHQGWFQPRNDSSKILNTLNVDFGDTQGVSSIKIHGMHKCIYNSGFDNKDTSYSFSAAKLVFNELHQINKNILQKLLKQSVKNAINLIGEES